ncbi:hypothetical protein MMC21_002596 [Puttea exsequens]|nr:hypothetical protein [Puttea exsequens]
MSRPSLPPWLASEPHPRLDQYSPNNFPYPIPADGSQRFITTPAPPPSPPNPYGYPQHQNPYAPPTWQPINSQPYQNQPYAPNPVQPTYQGKSPNPNPQAREPERINEAAGVERYKRRDGKIAVLIARIRGEGWSFRVCEDVLAASKAGTAISVELGEHLRAIATFDRAIVEAVLTTNGEEQKAREAKRELGNKIMVLCQGIFDVHDWHLDAGHGGPKVEWVGPEKRFVVAANGGVERMFMKNDIEFFRG